MVREKFVFINRGPGRSSKRADELEVSKAKAHAAAVSYHRRVTLDVSSIFSAPITQAIIEGFQSVTSPTTSCDSELDSHSSSSEQARSHDADNSPPNHVEEPEDWLVSQSMPMPPQDSLMQNGAIDFGYCGVRTTDIAPLPPNNLVQNEAVDFGYCGWRTTDMVGANTNMIVPSPYPGFGCFREEMFSGIPNGNLPYVRHHVDFQSNYLNASNDVGFEIFNVTNPYWLLTSFSTKSLTYDATLALSSHHLETLTGHNSTRSRMVMVHKGKAMARIQEHLLQMGKYDSVADEGLLLGILCLAMVEIRQGNAEAAQQHLQGLRKIANVQGGLQDVAACCESPEKNLIMTLDFHLAISGVSSFYAKPTKGRTPNHPKASYDQHLRRILPKLPTGFQSLLSEQKLSLDALCMLERAVRVNIASATPSQSRQRAELRNKDRKYVSIFEACPSSNLLDSGVCQWENMLSLTLLLYCSIAFGVSRKLHNVNLGCRVALSRKLAGYEPRSASQTTCLAWMFLVTVESFKEDLSTACLQPEGHRLLHRFFKKFPAMSSVGWEEMERLLSSFFWTPELSKFWRRSWEHLKPDMNWQPLQCPPS